MKYLKQISKNISFLRYTKMAIAFLILITTALSCSKSSDDEDDKNGVYVITFEANGILQKFTSDHFPIGDFHDNGTQYSGLFKANQSASSIGIQVYDNKPITEKTLYKGYAVTQATQTPAYAIGATLVYKEGQNTYVTPYVNPDVTVKIEKITTTTATGTFSGTLKSSGKPDVIITNGKFHVPLGDIPS